MKMSLFALVAFVFLGLSNAVVAQLILPGYLDASFMRTASGLPYSSIQRVVRQKDGKLIIAGTFSTIAGERRRGIARVLPDLKLDRSFNPGLGFSEGSVRAMVLLADGKILVGGDFNSYNGAVCNKLVRLHPDGSRDLSFAGNANAAVNGLAVRGSDGKILVGGDFTDYNGLIRNRVVLALPNGEPDETFIPGAGANTTVRAVAFDSEDRVVIGGDFGTYKGASCGRVVRILENGDFDASFDVGLGATGGVVLAVLPREGGKVLIGGSFTSYKGTARVRLAGINADGSLDTNFVPGLGADAEVTRLIPAQDGSVYIVGAFENFNSLAQKHLARLQATGAIDPSFAIGDGPNWDMSDLIVLPDRGILGVGDFLTFNGRSHPHLVQLDEAGVPNPRVNPGGGFITDEVRALVAQPDGKIIVGGDFESVQGIADYGITRLLPDGTRDPAFDPEGGTNDSVHSVAMRSDGKILIGGEFTEVGGVPRRRVARLNEDGTRDTTFTSVNGPNAVVRVVVPLSNGQILAGGAFTSHGGNAAPGLARLNENGTFDNTFAIGTGFTLGGGSGEVRCIHFLPSGNILVGGSFDAYKGAPVQNMVLIEDDGDLLSNNYFANGPVNCITMVDSNALMIGGEFTEYESQLAQGLALITPFGYLADSYVQGEGAESGGVRSILRLPGEKFLIGGDFDDYDGNRSGGIARVFRTGRVDPSWGTFEGDGDNREINALIATADGKAIVGGGFQELRAAPSAFLARMHLEPQLVATRFAGISQPFDPAARYFGNVSVSMSAKGTFSAVVLTEGERLTFRGQIDRDSRLQAAARMRDGSSLVLDGKLQLESTNQASIRGTLSDYRGDSAPFAALAGFYDARQRPAVHTVGTYHAALYDAVNGRASTDPAIPSGYSYMTIKVARNGGAKIVGKLADNTPITLTAQLDARNNLLFHRPLYGKDGFFNGGVNISNEVLDSWSPGLRPVTVGCLWNRPAGAVSRPFAGGFRRLLTSEGGSLFLPPPADVPPMGVSVLDSFTARIEGAGVAVPLTSIVNVSLAGKGIVSGVDANITDLKVTVNRKTGLLSGSCRPFGPGTKIEPIRGVVVNPIQAYGFLSAGSGASRLPIAFSLILPP